MYQEVDYFFTDAVSDDGDYRYVEPPDNGLYRFDPDTVRFERNAHRDACRTMPSRCRTPPPVTLNKPAFKELYTPFEYDVAGAGGSGLKPCGDSFCRDQKK